MDTRKRLFEVLGVRAHVRIAVRLVANFGFEQVVQLRAVLHLAENSPS